MRYIAPDPDGHGHVVLRNSGNLATLPYFIGNTQRPDTKESWIALMTEQDADAEAYARRRHLREKTSVKLMKIQGGSMLKDENFITEDTMEQIEEEQVEMNVHQERMKTVLSQESQLMLKEEVETRGVTFDELRRLKMAMPEVAEDDVLRTRIISVPELMAEKEKWYDAIQTELRQLFEEKLALLRLSESELQEVRERYGHRLVVIPMKGVLTKKPGPRRRFRLVACGNFVEKEANEMDVYASGADAVTVRYALKRAAEEQWSGVVIDIKVAFLNAPLIDDDDGEDPAAVILRPPPLPVKLGFGSLGNTTVQTKRSMGCVRARRGGETTEIDGY